MIQIHQTLAFNCEVEPNYRLTLLTASFLLLNVSRTTSVVRMSTLPGHVFISSEVNSSKLMKELKEGTRNSLGFSDRTTGEESIASYLASSYVFCVSTKTGFFNNYFLDVLIWTDILTENNYIIAISIVYKYFHAGGRVWSEKECITLYFNDLSVFLGTTLS